MSMLKKIVLIALLLPVVWLLVSLFLPSRYRVERALLMKTTAGAVLTRINTLKTWPEWTAWTVAKYPDMRISFSGPEAGVGATYSWQGKSTGHGTLKITRSDPEKGIGYDLDFENGKYLSRGAILLEPAGDAVKVTWSNEGDLGWNPVSRYFGLLMDRMMGPDFEEGLRNLKREVESK